MDRNMKMFSLTTAAVLSPPARVAWIETLRITKTKPLSRVATRGGGVDRNAKLGVTQEQIEVATREGGVDRNSSQ